MGENLRGLKIKMLVCVKIKIKISSQFMVEICQEIKKDSRCKLISVTPDEINVKMGELQNFITLRNFTFIVGSILAFVFVFL